MLWLDVVFLAAVAVGFPLREHRSFPRVMRRIALGEPGARVASYRETMAWEWSLLGAAVAVWLLGSRSFPEIGLGAPGGWGFWVALGMAAAAALALDLQLRAVRRSEEARAEVRTQLGGTLVFLPRARAELPAFLALSVTAGVCEEILYRGWLLGVLVPWMGMPAAIALATLVFGLAHTYAGPQVALRAGALGLGFALLYVLSGSLWVPILLHAFVDWNAGLLSLEAHRDAS